MNRSLSNDNHHPPTTYSHPVAPEAEAASQRRSGRSESSSTDRRAFLARVLASSSFGLSVLSAGVVGSGLVGADLGMASVSAAESSSSAESIQLSPARDRDLFRVRMQVDVKGNVNLPKDPLVPNSKKQLFPIVGKISLDYEERFLRPVGADEQSAIIAAERRYHTASGISRINKTEQKTELREDLAEVIARREELPETIYASDDYLNHDEVDLLRSPLSSVSIDELIPTRTMRPGEKTTVDSAVLASVLNLTAIAESDVQLELVSHDENQAKLQLQGKLDGSVSGVPTQLRIIGKLTFDLRERLVSWAAVAIHETREIGKAEPGFDVTATIRMVRKPLDKPQTLAAKPALVNFDQTAPKDRLLMTVQSEHVGVNALLDRRWRVMQDAPGESILRMIDNERNIAQCNLRPLPRLKPGEQWTLEAFADDVKRSLGDQLGQLLQAEQNVSDSGLRVLRVVASGQVQGVPIQWIMMHFSDDEGRRVQATLTMDGESVPMLDGSDVQLAATLQLTDTLSGVASNDETPSEKSSVSIENQLESSKTATRDVSSASDLRLE